METDSIVAANKSLLAAVEALQAEVVSLRAARRGDVSPEMAVDALQRAGYAGDTSQCSGAFAIGHLEGLLSNARREAEMLREARALTEARLAAEIRKLAAEIRKLEAQAGMRCSEAYQGCPSCYPYGPCTGCGKLL